MFPKARPRKTPEILELTRCRCMSEYGIERVIHFHDPELTSGRPDRRRRMARSETKGAHRERPRHPTLLHSAPRAGELWIDRRDRILALLVAVTLERRP